LQQKGDRHLDGFAERVLPRLPPTRRDRARPGRRRVRGEAVATLHELHEPCVGPQPPVVALWGRRESFEQRQRAVEVLFGALERDQPHEILVRGGERGVHRVVFEANVGGLPEMLGDLVELTLVRPLEIAPDVAVQTSTADRRERAQDRLA